DTEVLAHLYEEEGRGLAARLKGMFAFAIYDLRRRRLLLGRDRFGIKPLYVATLHDQLVFASEIKAILAVSGCAREIDRQACCDFLGMGYVPEPATGFAGIRMIPRGTTLLAGQEGEQALDIGSPRAEPHVERSLEEAVDAAEAALLAAARRQSFADVPVA